MRSLARRLEREQRERVQLAVLLARAMGADVRMPEEPWETRDDDLETALRRWGGEVEEV
jgi:predicted SpoU family rRNA methylase